MLQEIALIKDRQKQMLLLGKTRELETLLTGEKHDTTGAASAPYGHGTGGLFNQPYASNQVFGAMMYPDTTSLGDIPVVNNAIGQEDGQFGGVDQVSMPILTGVTAGALDDPANQPTGDCAVGPEPGLTKLGTVVNIFGRYRGSTRPVSIVRAGMRSNILDPIALRLMNMPSTSNRFMPQLPVGGNILINEISRRVFELVTSFQRMFASEVWIGNPASNSGQRRFLWGLNSQINTGTHVDMISSAVLTAANPFIHNFQYGLVSGAANIVQAIEEADRQVMYRAIRQRLNPYTYTLRMRPELFVELTAVWPVKAYFEALQQINNFTNGRVVIDARDALTARDQLRSSQTLPINGHFVEVVLDDAMSEQNITNNAAITVAGSFASDIVATPKTVLGGIPALYFDYFNHDNENANSLGQLAGPFATFTSDSGLFRWYVNFTAGCIQLTFDMLPRLNLIASQLAYRITNVAYRPLQHYITMQPSSAYFVDGGNTTQQAQLTQFYTGWSPSTPATLGWTG